MIVTRITGGLGNQLFQYAMGRRLAWHHKTELLLDTTGYGESGEKRPTELSAFTRPLALFRFSVSARVARPEEIARLRDGFCGSSARDRFVRLVRRVWPLFLWKKSHIIERQYRFQPEALDYPDELYLQGYWQSEKYFADIAPAIRRELVPVDKSVSESAVEFVANLRSRHGQVVSLHVRRGDMAHALEVLNKPHIIHSGPVGLEYLREAMARFPAHVCFLVFSDSPNDIRWCRENLRAPRIEFSTAESDLWDFCAMSACDHHIIANSTFSWWAAWLDDKEGRRVVAPRVWSSPYYRTPMPTDDLLPADWEIIG